MEDFENTAPTALVDPQLDLLNQVNAATETMPYTYSAGFEPWNTMFGSTGEFPQTTQDDGMMDSDPYSDTASSMSFGNDQNSQFFMSPIHSLNPDDSPGNTSIATSLSEPGASNKPETLTNTNTNTNTNINTNNNTNTNTTSDTKKKALKTAKSKKGHRRSGVESEKKEKVKQRNRVAASKCRQKKKVKVDELKDIESNMEVQHGRLRLEYQRLCKEIGELKSELINHSACNDANIDRWIQNEASGYVQKLVDVEERQRMESISSLNDNPMGSIQGGLHDNPMGGMQMQSF